MTPRVSPRPRRELWVSFLIPAVCFELCAAPELWASAPLTVQIFCGLKSWRLAQCFPEQETRGHKDEHLLQVPQPLRLTSHSGLQLLLLTLLFGWGWGGVQSFGREAVGEDWLPFLIAFLLPNFPPAAERLASPHVPSLP